MSKKLLLCLFLLSLLANARLRLSAQSSPEEFFLQGLRPAFADDLAAYPNLPRHTYALTLSADYEQAVLAGTGRIVYTNLTGVVLDELVLRLYPNLVTFGGDAQLSNLRVDGQPLEPTLDATRSVVGVPLPQTLGMGGQVMLDFDYSVSVRYGLSRLYNQFSYLETELALASLLPLLSVYEEGLGWWRGVIHAQGDAVYSEVGNFDVSITAPAYLRLITTGVQVSETYDATTNSLRHHYAAPLVRDFTLIASAKYRTLSTMYEDIVLEVHYLPGGEAAAQRALTWTRDAVAAFSQTFGPYPYPELDVVETWTAAGGIEYPNLIVVADSFWNANSRKWFEWITVHEVAHQWWYALVGNNQPLYPWLDEALTDYSVGVYEGYVRGEGGYQARVADWVEEYSEYEAQFGAMTIGASAMSYGLDDYLPIVYRKGATFFHTLRDLLGPDLFFQALQTYFSTYRYRVATPFDLQAILEASYGQSLDNLFITWIGYSN
jgi:hypothetical protein